MDEYDKPEVDLSEARVRSVFGKVVQPGLPGARVACMHGMYVCVCIACVYGINYVCIACMTCMYV